MTQIIFYSVFRCMCTYPSKLKATTKQDIREHLCSCRPLAQGHWSCTPIHWNRYFYSYTLANLLKDIFRNSFYHCVVFCQFMDREIVVFNVKKFPVCSRYNQVSGFFYYYYFFCIRPKWVNSICLSYNLSPKYGSNVKH